MVSDGPQRLLEDALRRMRMGGAVGGLWGALLLGSGLFQLTGAAGFCPSSWNIGAGITALLFSLGATARSRAAMAILASLGLGELATQAVALPEVLGHDDSVAQILAAVRFSGLPFVLYVLAQAYSGSVDYHRVRRGQAPTNWRVITPTMLKACIVGAYGVALLVGLVHWKSAVLYGFAQPGGRVLRKAATPAPFAAREAGPIQAVEETRDADTAGSEKRDESGAAGSTPPTTVAPDEKSKPVDEQRAAPAVKPAMLPKPVREAVELGTRFAAKTDNAGCLVEAMRRQDACKDAECRKLASVFIVACLPASRPTKDFCAGVPSPASIVETTAWRVRVCDQSGRAPEPCYAFFTNLQVFCHPEKVERRP